MILKQRFNKTLAVSVSCLFTCFASSNAQAISYSYDNLNRLSRVSYENGNDIVYQYDASGNILKITTNANGNETTQLQAAFIERLYLNILGRQPDSGGAAYWLDSIQSTSATFVAFAFFNSPEFQAQTLSDSEFISVIYNTLLGREADEGGLNFWLGLINEGLLREFVLYSFFQSAEFKALAEQSNTLAYSESDHTQFLVKDFVRRLYVNVLGREPEQGGMDYWSGRLFDGSATASVIVQGFFFSNEFINQGHGDSAFVEIAYETILDRSSDIGGKNFWLGELANGLTRLQLIQGFIQSQEFESLAASYGIQAY